MTEILITVPGSGGALSAPLRSIVIEIPNEGTVIEIRHTHTKPDSSEQVKNYRLHANTKGIHL